MTALRVGIIGCGWAGERHAAAYLGLRESARIVAAADVVEEVAHGRASDWGADSWTVDYRELLARDDVDAVSICLPHSLHAEAAIEAAKCRKHILIEKPLASTLDEADQMIEAADANAVTLMVAETVRFNPSLREAARLIATGYVGDLILLRVDRLHNMHDYLRARPWFLTDPAGGIMTSGGIHDFETVRMLGGEIDDVYAVQAKKALAAMSADDSSVAIARLKSGAVATIAESFSTRTHESGTRVGVHGTEASLWISGATVSGYAAAQDNLPGEITEFQVEPGNPFDLEVAHFIECVEDGSVPLTSGRDQRRPLVAVIAAYRSMDTRGAIKLDSFS